jgi:hypothetical protein
VAKDQLWIYFAFWFFFCSLHCFNYNFFSIYFKLYQRFWNAALDWCLVYHRFWVQNIFVTLKRTFYLIDKNSKCFHALLNECILECSSRGTHQGSIICIIFVPLMQLIHFCINYCWTEFAVHILDVYSIYELWFPCTIDLAPPPWKTLQPIGVWRYHFRYLTTFHMKLLIMFLNFIANEWTIWFQGSNVIDNDPNRTNALFWITISDFALWTSWPASFKWRFASIPYAQQKTSCSQGTDEGVNENWYL